MYIKDFFVIKEVLLCLKVILSEYRENYLRSDNYVRSKFKES
jgi:hypothetical protein